MQDNTYVLVAARMTDEDLLDALTHHEKYVDDMLLAMLDVAEKRALPIPGMDTLRADIIARQVPEPEPEVIVEDRPIPVELPVLYSQTAILAFTIFFSPLFGGILLAMNTNRLNKKAVWQVVVFSLILSVASGLVTWYLAPGSFWGILAPIACGLILSELAWNRFIGKQLPYRHRRVLIPLIIALAITLPLGYYAYQHPEVFELPTSANE
jgi:hypothetical protein